MSGVLSQIKESVDKVPTSLALTLGDTHWSYQALWNRSVAIKLMIQQISSKSGAIGIYTDNTPDMYAAILGCWMAGFSYVPLNHKFPIERLKKIASDSQLDAIICESKSIDAIRNWELQIPLLSYQEVASNVTTDSNQIMHGHHAYTLFTSGSTGIPKGIPIDHSHLSALLDDLVVRYPLTSKDKVLQAFELSFDVSIACILMAWTQGAQLVVADLNGITAINAFKAIYDHQVNVVTLPPSALHYLKRLKMLSMPLPWVEKTIFTGEALSLNVANEWKGCAIHSTIDNAYGPTEGTVWSLIYKLDKDTESQIINGLCPIGQPLKNISMRIVNEEGIEVAPGERGELWIGGNQIFHGYVLLPEKTNEVVWKDNEGCYWYKTGDIVLQNEHQQVVYINRKDNQVQVNGFRVELGEIEHHLRKIIASEAAIVLAAEKAGVMELFAFVQGDWKQEELLASMREKVPGYMIPRKIYVLEQLPVNTSGKIDKTLLKEKYINQ